MTRIMVQSASFSCAAPNDEGIPDGAATLIYRAGNASHRGVAIYEWRG